MKYLAKISNLTDSDKKALNLDPNKIKTDSTETWYEADTIDECDIIADLNTERFTEANAEKNFSLLTDYLESLNNLCDLGEGRKLITWQIEKGHLYIDGNNGALGNLFSLLCYNTSDYCFYLTDKRGRGEIEVLYIR